MGRGAQASTIRASDQERAAADAFNQQLQAQLGQTRNILLPQYQNILNNPGLSAADKAAVTSGSLGSLASAFDALQQSAANRLARTQGREAAGAAQQNELAFSNTAFNRQMAALQGIAGLYGVDTGLLGRALGIPAELLNVRANAARPSGFFSSLGSSLGSTLGALPGALF